MLGEIIYLSVEPAQKTEVHIFFSDHDCGVLIDHCEEMLFN